MSLPTLHCQSELDSDLGYEGLLPTVTLHRWADDRYSTSKHLLTLYSIARGLCAQEIVEIGFGRSTFVLARAAAENDGHLTTCDTRDFGYLLSPQERAVTRYATESSEAFWREWRRPIDLAFLDHLSNEELSHDDVCAELEACLRFLRPDGIVAIHDCHDRRFRVGDALHSLAKGAGVDVVEHVILPFNYGLGLLRKRPSENAVTHRDLFTKKPDLPLAQRPSSCLAVYHPPVTLDIPTLHSQRFQILYLCLRSTFERKMSRVRFHNMRAIGTLADVVWSGPGWPDWDSDATVQANVENLYQGHRGPDLIVAYKPLEMAGFSDTEAPRCIQYNEMYDEASTLNEILEARANLVICHHRNDLDRYAWLLRDVTAFPLQLSGLSHCAEASIYRDYGLPKTIDVLLVGARGITSTLGRHYPLRDRMPEIVRRLPNRFCCETLEHPGYDLPDASTDQNAIEYAQRLNRAKICVTCSGLPRSRFGKYVEIPMSGSALAADLPDEDHDFFKSFMIVLDPHASDDAIAEKLVHYLEHDSDREDLIRRGLAASQKYTQQHYAVRFIQAVAAFLQAHECAQ